MKKGKATVQTNKSKSSKKANASSKPKSISKSRSALESTLVSTDIRKAYKNRLINAYFNRIH